MSILEDITIREIPNRIKVLIALSLVLFSLLSGYAIYVGLKGESLPNTGSIEAAIYLISAITPVIAIVFLSTIFASSESQSSRRTEHFITKEIPEALSKIIPPRSEYIKFNSRGSSSKDYKNSSSIYINHKSNDFCIDYLITPTSGNIKSLYIKIELNVFRVNVNIGIDENTYKEVASGDNQPLKEIFPHTFSGAENSIEKFCYSFNNTNIKRKAYIPTVTDSVYVCTVGTTSLPDDFIHKKSYRQYFSQDLMLMLRSFLEELEHKKAA